MLETLGAPDQHSKKGGRPSEIDDAAILDRCSRLLGPLQYQWSEIGWYLQRAKTMSDIRCAFESVKEPWRQDFELFLHEATQKATMIEARALRKRIKRLGVLVRDAYLEQQKAKERLDRALQIASDHGENEKTLKLCKEQRAQHASTALVLRELEDSVKREQEDVQKKNAFLAQSALLKFIREKRYEPVPIKIAQAMAGAPYMDYRQSITRCKELTEDQPMTGPYGFAFETFQEASRALNELPQDIGEAVACVEAYLTSKRHRNAAIERLRHDWYFFRAAIEKALANRPLASAMPFVVFAEYQRRMSSPNLYELEMAETQRLS